MEVKRSKEKQEEFLFAFFFCRATFAKFQATNEMKVVKNCNTIKAELYLKSEI